MRFPSSVFGSPSCLEMLGLTWPTFLPSRYCTPLVWRWGRVAPFHVKHACPVARAWRGWGVDMGVDRGGDS